MEPSATTILADLASLSSREKEHSNAYRIWSILGVMDYWSRDNSSEEDLNFLHLSAPMARLYVYDCHNPSKTPSPLPPDKKKYLVCAPFSSSWNALLQEKPHKDQARTAANTLKARFMSQLFSHSSTRLQNLTGDPNRLFNEKNFECFSLAPYTKSLFTHHYKSTSSPTSTSCSSTTRHFKTMTSPPSSLPLASNPSKP